MVLNLDKDYRLKPITKLYDKLNYDGYNCLYGIHEDVGFQKDYEFPCGSINFNDVTSALKLKNNFYLKDMVAVISDTHMYEGLLQIIDYLNALGIKHLIHAGDIGHVKDLEAMNEFNGRIYGVLGNHDRQYAGEFLQYFDSIHNDRTGKFSIRYDYLRVNILEHEFTIIHEHNDVIEDWINLLTFNVSELELKHRKYYTRTIVFGHIHRPLLFQKLDRIYDDYRQISPTLLNPGFCCKIDVPNIEVENFPQFCLYNVNNPVKSVFVCL